MLTFPITTPRFHSRVLSTLSLLFSDISRTQHGQIGCVEPLSPEDTQLTPDNAISSIIGVTSPWIDLSSPDPIIADISRQVLQLELAYAAFCGVSYVIVHGPRQRSGPDIAAYARAILNGMDQGPYMQLFLWMDMSPSTSQHEQVGDLASFARREYTQAARLDEDNEGILQAWKAWNTVRTVCKYSTRLNIGKVPVP